MKCTLCKKPIASGALRAEFSGPFGDGVDWVEDYHPLCATLDTPTTDLSRLGGFDKLSSSHRAFVIAASKRLNALPDVRVVWRHATAVRCIVQTGATSWVLFYDGTEPPLVVEGTLREVVASVPDADFEAATAAMAAAEAKRPRALKRTRHQRESIWIDELMKGL